MIIFILSAVAITLICVALLIRPLLKQRSSISYERRAQNIHFAKERMIELEEQLSNASISATEYEALKLEIEANLATDIDIDQTAADDAKTEVSEANGVAIAILACLIPFGALITYQITGNSKALSEEYLTSSGNRSVASSSGGSNTTQTPNTGEMPADIETMVGALETRMQANPNDIQGWTMLARSYAAMGRYSDAIRANKHILEVGGENPDILTALADSTALQVGGRLAGAPMEYVSRALLLNGQHPHALWLAGLNAAQLGNLQQSKQYWGDLLPLLANQPDQQNELREVMRQTFGENTNIQRTPDQASPQSLAREDSSNVSSGTDDQAPASLSVYVTLSQELLASSAPDDLVFVFARAQSGPPAPLAVRRVRVSDLPIRISLSDADSMIPQFKLSMFDEVSVSARVAKSGDPVAKPGDFQSIPIVVETRANAVVELEIDQIVP